MRKYALITGSSGGIGKAIALKLASQGYHLYLHYNQNDTSIEELVESLKVYDGEYYTLCADFSDSDGYKKVAASIFNLDVIVHCVGNAHYGMLLDLKLEEAESLMRIHVTSPLMLTKELLPKMMAKREGNIVVISSIWGQVGAACEVAYSTVKGAQIAFVKALSKELALSGIRVNAVAPGAIQTAMMANFPDEDIATIQDDIPMGRLGIPEEVANGVSFLVSDESSYMTGQVLAINGGWYV